VDISEFLNQELYHEYEVSVSKNENHVFLYARHKSGAESESSLTPYLFVLSTEAGVGVIQYISDKKGSPLEEIEFEAFAAHVGASIGTAGMGYELEANIISGEVSFIDFSLGVGLSSNVGIKDDSLNVQALGLGFTVGKKIGVSIFDNEIAIDFGKIAVGITGVRIVKFVICNQTIYPLTFIEKYDEHGDIIDSPQAVIPLFGRGSGYGKKRDGALYGVCSVMTFKVGDDDGVVAMLFENPFSGQNRVGIQYYDHHRTAEEICGDIPWGYDKFETNTGPYFLEAKISQGSEAEATFRVVRQ